MKRKVLAGILAASFVLLSACATGDDRGEIVSLEPYSLKTDGAPGSAGAAAESNNGAAGASGVSNAGLENNRPENGNAGNLSAAASDTEASEQGVSIFGAGAYAGAGVPASGVSAEPGQNVPVSGASAESGQNVPASGAGTEMQSLATEGISGICGEIYLQVINEKEDDNKTYALIYLDADDIPELVIHDLYFEKYFIYTIRDNESFCMADSVSTVELTYFERSGIIVAFSRWNGGGDTGGFGRSYYQTSGDRTLMFEDQSEEPVLSYSYNATYNEKGEYMGTGVFDYFYMGQKIDESKYYEKMSDFGIAEGEDQLCMENSCNKEEIIAILSQ